MYAFVNKYVFDLFIETAWEGVVFMDVFFLSTITKTFPSVVAYLSNIYLLLEYFKDAILLKATFSVRCMTFLNFS